MEFMFSLVDRGLSSRDAAAASLALHPLDDNAVPSREFETQVQKLSQQFAKRSRTASPEQIASDSQAALAEYKQLAISLDETYYSTRYDIALQADDEGERD